VIDRGPGYGILCAVSLIAALLRLRRTQLWLLAHAGLATALCFTPLFNLLGYEFCLALGLLVSLGGAHLGSLAVGLARGRDEAMLLGLRPPLPALLGLLARAVGAALLLLPLPLALISLNALRVKNCDYLEGLAFFAIMPVCSAICAAVLGALWALAVPRRALATLLALLTVIGSLAICLYRFYASPPIFAYDPFLGFFPGTLYDETVAIQRAFLWYRLYNLFWLLAAVLLAARAFDPSALQLARGARARSHSRPPTAATIIVLGAALLLTWLRAPLGFLHDEASIRDALGGLTRTTHFEIVHPRELEPRTLELIARDHELRYAQLSALLGVAPRRITSYLFRSPEEKRVLMGAENTFIAKPWRREVYLQQLGFPHRVLKHELAHVFAGEFGDRLFAVSLRWSMRPLPHPTINVGLIEGVAVAADWRRYGELDGHQMSAALRRIGLAPPLDLLFGTGFLTQAAGRAYTLAGSFCRFLLERHGAARLRRVYASGGDFDAAYGKPLSVLLEEWTRFLDKLPLPERELQLARESFRAPSILRRVCGHEVASLLREAERLGGERKHEEAIALYARVAGFDPGEPRHLLAWIRELAAAGRVAEAVGFEERALAHPALSAPLRREVHELVGDLRWRAGELAAAGRAYQEAGKLAAAPAERRVLRLKRWAIARGDPVRRLIRDYLVPPPGKRREGALEVHLAHELARALPRSGLGPYLVGKQLAGRGEHSEAVAPLRQALRLGLPDADFVVEAGLVLGQSLYQTGDTAGAIETLGLLAANPELLPGTWIEARDWLERATFRREGRLLSP
jgi:tetratricopeptide (TPR) repeat protein